MSRWRDTGWADMLSGHFLVRTWTNRGYGIVQSSKYELINDQIEVKYITHWELF